MALDRMNSAGNDPLHLLADVLVLGGGPSGAWAARAAAGAGARVVLADKRLSRHKRRHGSIQHGHMAEAKLLKGAIDYGKWVDTSYLDAAYKDLDANQ